MTHKKPNVLIVEDNPGDIELIRLAFSELDFDITFRVFEDGQDALDFLLNPNFDSDIFDLMIMDLNLPGMLGFEVLKGLKGHDVKIPIVIFSSLKNDEYQNRARDFGVEEYQVKPTSTQEYFRIVQSFSRYW